MLSDETKVSSMTSPAKAGSVLKVFFGLTP